MLKHSPRVFLFPFVCRCNSEEGVYPSSYLSRYDTASRTSTGDRCCFFFRHDASDSKHIKNTTKQVVVIGFCDSCTRLSETREKMMVSWLSCRLLKMFLQSLRASGPNFFLPWTVMMYSTRMLRLVLEDGVAFRRMFHARAQRFSFGFASEALVRCWR